MKELIAQACLKRVLRNNTREMLKQISRFKAIQNH